MEQYRPSAKRRIVSGETTLEEAIALGKKPILPKSIPSAAKEITELARVERQVHLGNLMLNQYQDKLEKGVALDTEEQRLFISHQDSLRKLEMSFAALKAKAELGSQSDLEVAQAMLRRGMSKDDILNIFVGNREVEREL